MAAESVKVVLSGEGADELFGGYPYYQECLAFAPYMAVPVPMRRAASAAARHLPEGTHGRRFLLRGAHGLPERYIRLEYNFAWAEALGLLAPEVGARCAAAPAPWELTAPLFAEIVGSGKACGDAPDEVTAMQTADILTWLQQDILLKADKMSMASSLELRVPFLDREVFALASTLPARQRVGRHETKIALRAAGGPHAAASHGRHAQAGLHHPARPVAEGRAVERPGPRGAEQRARPSPLPHRTFECPARRAPSAALAPT